MSEPIRLAKRLAEVLSCSRREAEHYIAGGWVSVEGQTVEDPASRVLPEQTLTLAPEANLEPVLPVTIALHKPAGVVLTAENAAGFLTAGQHWAEDASGVRPLRRHTAKLVLCMPLEAEVSGVVVLTQDWRVQRKLVEDARLIEQEYVFEIAGVLTEVGLKSLNQALRCKASRQSETRLRLASKNVGATELRQMCEAAGVQVTAMRRLRIGRQSLAGMPLGEWRYLNEYERF